MALMEFFGCTFIAFGPPVALFIFTIVRDPLRIIVLTASAFFWLLALLLSSILWFAVVPLRQQLAFGLVFSVLFQELLRLAFYALLRKADAGLQRVTQGQDEQQLRVVKNKHLMAYVAGLGFGLMSGAFSIINILADMTGPGTVGIHGEPQDFFLVSAFLTLCFIFLHTFWGVIFFAALDRKVYWQAAIVVASHMLVSCLTLLNQGANPMYPVTLAVAYGTMTACGLWAFQIGGGSIRSLKSCALNQRSDAYDVN